MTGSLFRGRDGARWTKTALWALVIVGSLFAPASVGASATSKNAVRIGTAPRSPHGARALGPLDGSSQMSVVIALKPRDSAGLAAFATAVSTPGSPAFRRYLTVARFAQRFGPTEQQVAAIEASLRAHGLTPGPVPPNGMIIPVKGAAAAIERAFSVSLDKVRLPDGRVAFANSAAPLLDSSIAGSVSGVVGLDSLALPQPQLIKGKRASRSTGSLRTWRVASPNVVTGGPQPCTAATGGSQQTGAYTADQLASAYGFSSLYQAGDTGAGQTAALFELEPNSTSDIAAYQQCYGTNTSVSYVQVQGGAGTGSGSGEAALDIEDVLGLAPAVNVLVYQGPNTVVGLIATYGAIISQDKAQVISTSWGLCDPNASSVGLLPWENALFQEAAAQGQSIYAASGDLGDASCGSGAGLAAGDPASQPFATGVGGTSLTALGPPPTESVWNSGCSTACGSGGGVSSNWAMPGYQSGAAASLNVVNSHSSSLPCGAASGSYCREVPDVAADANPSHGYMIYYKGGWIAIGGTSAAAPLWGAFTALTNGSSFCGGTSIGFANPVLYWMGGTPAYHDITAGGSNDIFGRYGGLYPAGSGYDMATGLGSPNGGALSPWLCGLTKVLKG